MAKKVLVADDDQNISDLLKIALEGYGYDVTIARDGAQAIKKAIEIKPDVLILDIMMPKADGCEVLKVVKSMPDLQKVGIIMLTSKNLIKDIETTFSLGADNYVTKPFQIDRLVAKIEKLCGEKNKKL
ncbi:MAG: response regulator [Elusimicrobiota bacterium]